MGLEDGADVLFEDRWRSAANRNAYPEKTKTTEKPELRTITGQSGRARSGAGSAWPIVSPRIEDLVPAVQ